MRLLVRDLNRETVRRHPCRRWRAPRDGRRLRVEKLESRCLLTILADSGATSIAAMELASASDVISLRYDLPPLAMQATEEMRDGRVVSEAIMPGTVQSFMAGQPVLPLLPVEIVVPYGRAVHSIDVIPGEIVALAGSYAVPQGEQPALIDPHSGAAAPPPLDTAPAVQGTFPANVFDVVGVQRERGVDILRVNLNPVRYTIESGAVSYYATLTLNVALSESPAEAPSTGPVARCRPDGPRLIDAEVANPGALASYAAAAAAVAAGDAASGVCNPADSYQYVVITSQAMVNATADYTINDFVAFKQARGMSATVVTLESIYANYTGVDPPEQIRNFITDAYNNWETDFVLLGGDTNVVPYRNLWCLNAAVPSDMYYQCLDGNYNSDGDNYWGESTDGPGGSDVDLLPEVYIGRVSAETEAEMANWVYKAMAYQNTAAADYRRDVLMVGEHLGFGGVSEYATESMEEIRLGSDAHGYTTLGFAADPTFTTSTLYDSPTYTWSKNDLINIFNSGAHGIYNHLGHANTGYVMKLYNPDADTLTNDNFFFIYSQGCYPGDFPNDAIAEHFTTSTRHGAAAVVFNSRYGYGRYGSTDGPSQRPNREFWDALFNERLNMLGVMNADSHVDVLWGISDAYIRWVVYETTLFGDPATEVVSLDLGVVGSSPAQGQIVAVPPTDFVVTLSDTYLAESVDAADLRVNGIPAESFVLGAYSITFHYNATPVTSEGLQSMSIAAGAILRQSDGGENRAWNASFRYDAAPTQVTFTEPAEGSTALLPLNLLRLHFSEEVHPDSVGIDDLTLSQGTVTGALRTGSDTVEYTITGVAVESSLSVSVRAGALSDVYGNPSLAYSGTFSLDYGAYPFPTPLDGTAPRGSLVYEGSLAGHVTPAGDSDRFTIELEAGQTLTAMVLPDATLKPTVTVEGPGGTTGPAVAPGAGQEVFLQTVPVTATGIYTVTVGGVAGTTGGYTLRLVLNAAVEAESHGGAANDAFGSAQPLDAAFVWLGSAGQRAAVLGVTDPARTPFLFWDMEEDPGWTYAGAWAWGQPAGNGGDPDSGHTGTRVVGYNLEGQYANSKPIYYATTPPFSTLGKHDVELSFWRWLGVEASTYDHASIELSFDGATWTTVWANQGTISDSAWTRQTCDLSPVADNRPQVFLRFGMGPTSMWNSYCGWNLDDVALTAATPSNDYYSFMLAAGQTATVGVKSLAADAATLELYGPNHERLVLGAGGGPTFDNLIADFVAPAAGTYYVRVAGTGAPCSLVVTRGMGFEAERNDKPAAAQRLVAARTVLGYVGPGRGEPTEFLPAGDGAPGTDLPSAGRAPVPAGSTTPTQLDVPRLADYLAYGSAYTGSQVWTSFDLGLPEVVNVVGTQGYFYAAGDFDDSGDFSYAYAVNGDTGMFVRIDTATGGETSIGPITAYGNESFSGMAMDGTTSTMYACSTSVSASSLYTIDLATGVATRIGAITNSPGIIALAADETGQLYGHDITNDSLIRVDKTTGAGTIVGPLGFDANYAQGMDFDEEQGILYLAAYNNGTHRGELRVADRQTGATTLVGVLGSTAPGTAEICWLGIAVGGVTDDFYRIAACSGDALTISVLVPMGGPGAISNALDAAVELFDEAGHPVAFSSTGTLSHLAAADGFYTIRVLAENGTGGEYTLAVSGATGEAPGFAVQTPTDPPEGSRLRSATAWTIRFNDPILLSTLQASDLAVDGAAAAGVAVLDDRTLRFTLPAGLADGLHTLVLAAGALQDIQQTPLGDWSASFTLDTTAPRIIASSIQDGAVLADGDLTLTVQFDEPMRVANLDLGDLSLQGAGLRLSHAPRSWSYDSAGTTLTLVYAGLPDDSYTLTLRSGDGRFEDVVGVDLDGESAAWPLPPGVSGNGLEGGHFLLRFVVHAWGTNRAPAAADDLYDAMGYGQLTVAAPGVLVNDNDPDGDPLAALLVDPPARGTLILAADGSFQYTPEEGFLGTDQFIYRARDGAIDSVLPATVRIRVVPPRVPGDFHVGPADADPGSLVEVDGTLFFTATDILHGTELWRSDGTQNGTVLVRDIFPGAASSGVASLAGVGGTLFFAANNGVDGAELWRSDGTPEGTVIVKQIFPGSTGANPQYLVNVGGTLFFAATDADNGTELWRSDGTPEGTYLVKEIAFGGSSYPRSLVNVGGRLFFTAMDAATGRELWTSDGTPMGTMLVNDIVAGESTSSPSNLTAVGTKLFFTAVEGTTGTELWTSDGTAAGTVLVKDIGAGSASSYPRNLAAVGDKLFFRAIDSSHGAELWASDGTPAGTVLVKDIYAGSGHSSPSFTVNVAGVLYFTAGDGTHGIELWRSGGTAAGTVLVKDILPGTGSSAPQALANIGGVLYFTAADADGRELWRSDGTDPGTFLVLDIAASGSSNPLSLTDVGGAVYFSAFDETAGRELWRSGGTPSQTFLVRDINSATADSAPGSFTAVQDSVFFTMSTADSGLELWLSDGTTAGTRLVKDIQPGAAGSAPAGLVEAGARLFFSAAGDAGRELWSSDGTAAGTVMLMDINPGPADSSPMELANVNGVVFFAADDGTGGAELWRTDGTAAGTVMVKDIRPGDSSSNIAFLTNVGGRLFFQADNGTDGPELWTSDGTSAGTVMVKNICAGSAGSSPQNLVAVGDLLFFQATDGTTGYELWKSDGTSAGTVLVRDIYSGANSSFPRNLVNLNGLLCFQATDGNGSELWRSDGTSSGTSRLKDIASGSASSSPAWLTNVGGTLFFAAADANGAELWRSDGTAAGTVMVKDICPGSGGSDVHSITNVAGTAYFSADDGASGAAIWRSDGTAGGTAAAYLSWGGEGSYPQGLTALGRALFFSAVDRLAGRELWFLPDCPQVVSIVAVDTSPTGAAEVHYAVTFTRPVGAVDTFDFALYAEGLSEAAVTAVSGSGSNYTVTVAPGAGAGRLRLIVLDDDSIVDADGNPLGGPAQGNGGATSDQWYVVDRLGPSGRILDVLPNPRNAPVSRVGLMFTEAVTGLDLADLCLTRDGGQNLLTSAQTLTGAGFTWVLDNLAGLTAEPGQYTLRIVASGSQIVDAWGNAMGADAARSWSMADHAPPAASGEVYQTAAGTLLDVPAPGVLANDGCAGGYALSAWPETGPHHGTLSLSPNGSFRYTPEAGFAGTDWYTYRATDGVIDAAATVWLHVGEALPAADINTAAADSNLSNITEVNSLAFFIATDALHGAELWRTDGTASGTFLLKDIWPGTSSSSPAYLTNVNGTLYFRANDGTSGSELWRSDGTPEGTVMLKDIYPGSSGSAPSYLANLNGTLCFQAADPTLGTELWTSDGTPGGTLPVKDLYPGSNSSSPMYLVNVAGTLFFSATESSRGRELWQSDGTAQGTRLVADICPGTASSSPSSLIDVGGRLFFVANDGTTGAELWTSDGTPGGTALVKDIVPGTGSPSPTNLAAVGNILCFRATTSDCGTELWTSDGTEAGTAVVDIRPGTSGSNPAYLTPVNGILYFQANDATHGTELWKLAGTPLAPVLLDLNPGAGDSNPAYLANLNGMLCFRGWDSANGYELWTSDGTLGGTRLLLNIVSGSSSSSPQTLTAAGGMLYFSATDGTCGRELWRSDGSAAGTALLSDLRTGTADSAPVNLVNAGGTLYFRATSSSAGAELWKCDAAGTPALVKNIYSGSSSSSPAYLTEALGSLFFAATTSAGNELWRSDGSDAGTFLVKDIYPGTSSSNPSYLVSTGTFVLFRATDATNGAELWRTDGTEAGTTMVRDINPGSNSSNPLYLTNVNGTLFFQAASAGSGTELWVSDGTSEGTVLLDIWTGTSSSSPANLINAGGVLYFTASRSTGGNELWTSDGTLAGTVMVKDIYAGANGSYPANLVGINGLLFFSAVDAAHGRELWRSDGTAAGTVMVADICPGAGGSGPANLVNVDGTLFFTADDGNGLALWKSDGTPEGTVMVMDVCVGSGNPGFQNLTAADGLLFFAANDGVHGAELWRSDGTPEGTVMVADVGPGAESSDPMSLTACSGRLYFTAVDGLAGRELWSLVTNLAPVAFDDAYSVDEDRVLVVPAEGVLSNDHDPEGLPLQAVLMTGPSHGDVELNADGSFRYTPTPNFAGTDGFTYKVFDGHMESSMALVSIDVCDVNDPPLVAALAGSPDPVVVGEDLLLTATGVGDPHDPRGWVTNVAFYRESNGMPGLQVGGDTLVGIDEDPADGWSASLSTADLLADVYVWYAQATDNEDALSEAVPVSITVIAEAASLDADGNGVADALSDGILILRYLFDPTGMWNVDDALGAGAERSTRDLIKCYLDCSTCTTLDVDGNGAADPLTDGILILRYLFSPAGTWSVADALGAGATRTTLEEIRGYLDGFNPAMNPPPRLMVAESAPDVPASMPPEDGSSHPQVALAGLQAALAEAMLVGAGTPDSGGPEQNAIPLPTDQDVRAIDSVLNAWDQQFPRDARLSWIPLPPALARPADELPHARDFDWLFPDEAAEILHQAHSTGKNWLYQSRS